MSRKRKASLRERASEMNKLKVEKRLRSVRFLVRRSELERRKR